MYTIPYKTLEVLRQEVDRKKHKAYKKLVKEINKSGEMNLQALRKLHDLDSWVGLVRGLGCLIVYWKSRDEFSKGNLVATYTPTHLTIHQRITDTDDPLVYHKGVLLAEFQFVDVGEGVFQGVIPVNTYYHPKFFKGQLMS